MRASSSQSTVTLPDFIGLGAPRCGTRWLNHNLGKHPEIAVPQGEIYFFTQRRMVNSMWGKGVSWYSSQLEKNRTSTTRLVGEITPFYLFDEETPDLIQRTVPNVKLFCSLRSQLDRAFSWYELFLRFNPSICDKEFNFRKFLTYHQDAYGREGFYLDFLQRYFDRFPRENILILNYDNLASQPTGFFRSVLDFLNVKAEDPSSTRPQDDSLSKQPKAKKWYGGLPLLGSHPRTIRPKEWHIDGEIENRFKSIYNVHNEELGKLLQANLSQWNSASESSTNGAG